jgi:hypothetical protein
MAKNTYQIFLCEGSSEIIKAGRKVRFASVATIRVREVNHPNACVPPKPLKQKITNPAIKKTEV